MAVGRIIGVLCVIVIACRLGDCVEDLDAPAPVRQVLGVEGGQALLPCDVQTTIKGDSVLIVLWSRQGELSGKPVFSQDARGRTLSTAKISSVEPPVGFGKRAIPDVAGLRIFRLSAADAGVYRCRVDFANAPTANQFVNLTVVVPPKSMVILDGAEGSSGPSPQRALREGDAVHLICEVTGGDPKPEVIWSIDGRVIDTSYDHVAPNLTVNQLSMRALLRENQGQQLQCIAKNSELATPLTRVITIELLLRPLWVRMSRPSQTFVANHSVVVECRSGGSRPPATMSWWRGGQRVADADVKSSWSAGESLSVINLVPEPEDDERYLECRAENVAIAESTIFDRWKMVVHCGGAVLAGGSGSPQAVRHGKSSTGNSPTSLKEVGDFLSDVGEFPVDEIPCRTLSVADSLRRPVAATHASSEIPIKVYRLSVLPLHKVHSPAADPVSVEAHVGVHANLDVLRESQDAYFECGVRGNPLPPQVKWYHDGIPIVMDQASGIILSGYTLVLQRIRRLQSGGYTCYAENYLGNATSNSLQIAVQHAPICATHDATEVDAVLGQNAVLRCPITSHPAALTVRWRRGDKNPGIPLTPSIFTVDMAVTPVRRSDLGRYECWGINSVGEQTQPCRIDLIATGKPSPPTNCTANLDESHLRVVCVPGEPSGLEERLLMEIVSLSTGTIRTNLTAPWAPLVRLTMPWPPEADETDKSDGRSGGGSGGGGADGVFQARIRAVSSRGPGDPFVLTLPQLTTKVPSAEASSKVNEPLLVTVLASFAAILFVGSCSVILILVIRRRRFSQQRRRSDALKRTGEKVIVKTPLPRPKVKKVKEIDTIAPLVTEYKRHTIAPHSTRSLEVGMDQIPTQFSRGNRTLDRRKDHNGPLIKVKSLESCI